jgi:redox-sensitive bicupin YhaK (pirin superfamily)
MSLVLRAAARVVPSVVASDGAGVKLRRSIGTTALRHLDPFLMLDAFGTDNPDDYIAGFPAHPHRGFETVTYMLAGRMQHKDSVGNTGDLVAGSVQWMTAGRGIIHSEMPQQTEGRMAGFQLWVNLPASRKLTAPRYQDVSPEQIPVVTTAGGAVIKVVAGAYGGALGPVGGVDTEPTMLDVALRPGGREVIALPPGHTAFFYVFDGGVQVHGLDGDSPAHTLVVLGDGEAVELVGGAVGGRALLLAGRPLREPIVQYGPFVMNTRAEIERAIEDYQAGRFGG